VQVPHFALSPQASGLKPQDQWHNSLNSLDLAPLQGCHQGHGSKRGQVQLCEAPDQPSVGARPSRQLYLTPSWTMPEIQLHGRKNCQIPG
jgi:hypothetical protein